MAYPKSTKQKLNGEETIRYAVIQYDLRHEVMDP
jgi:hypothetical protein